MKPRYPGCYDLYAGQTPEQTVGPFFCQGLVRIAGTFQSAQLCRSERDVLHNLLADEATPGERLRIEGTVYDGLDRPIPAASRHRGRSPEPIGREPGDPPHGTAADRL